LISLTVASLLIYFFVFKENSVTEVKPKEPVDPVDPTKVETDDEKKKKGN